MSLAKIVVLFSDQNCRVNQHLNAIFISKKWRQYPNETKLQPTWEVCHHPLWECCEWLELYPLVSQHVNDNEKSRFPIDKSSMKRPLSIAMLNYQRSVQSKSLLEWICKTQWQYVGILVSNWLASHRYTLCPVDWGWPTPLVICFHQTYQWWTQSTSTTCNTMRPLVSSTTNQTSISPETSCGASPVFFSQI